MATTTPSGFDYTTTPITSTTPGEVIQNLVIDVAGDQPAIEVTSDDVTIRNVLIKTTIGDGIDVWGDNASISGVEVDGPTPTDNGGMDGGGSTGIYSYGVSGLKVDHATFRNTGTGIAAIESPGTVLSSIEGYNMQGPFPGGQLVQFGSSDGSSLNDFYVDNDADLSHPEDDISVIDSPNVTVSQGVIDGDNSPSGVGVMVEGASNGTRVTGVDASHMGDGAFSSYSDGVTFNDVHSFDNIATDQGRGNPLSGGLIFYAGGNDVTFNDATYTNPGDSQNIFSGDDSTDADVSQASSATPRNHITNSFAWSGATGGSGALSASIGSAGALSSGPLFSGVSSADGPGQIVSSTTNDVFDADGQANTTFVFKPGFGQDVVQNFVASGSGHDVLALPSSDFASLAAVLHDTRTEGGSATITDPVTQDAITLPGVSRSELRRNPGSIALHP